jgi:hypothetical protein
MAEQTVLQPCCSATTRPPPSVASGSANAAAASLVLRGASGKGAPCSARNVTASMGTGRPSASTVRPRTTRADSARAGA